MTLRALIAEDEPLATRALRDLVEADPRLELVGCAGDGAEALRLLDELSPDVVFLDIHMPELDGIEVLERTRATPAVIFTTAFDQHAVAAFELGAVDYLLKPFGAERFRAAVDRLSDTRGTPAWSVEELRDALEPARPLERLFARLGRRIVPIRVEHVIRFAGKGDYVEVHLEERSVLVSVSLSELEARLDPERFVRVHRSHIVNLDRIREISAEDERRLRIDCVDGSRVVASREGSARLRDRMR